MAKMSLLLVCVMLKGRVWTVNVEKSKYHDKVHSVNNVHE